MRSRNEEFMQKNMVVFLGAMLCCVLWGSAFPCIKIGYEMFKIESGAVADQIVFAGMRFTLAGLLTILIGSISSRKCLIPKRESLSKIAKLSVLQTMAQYLFFYVGLAHTSGVKASIIEGVNVFIAIIVASLIFHQEKLTVQKMAGCLIGFLGVIVVNLTSAGIDMNMSFYGEGFILLSTIAYAFSSVYLKRYSKEENPVILSGYQFIIGGLVMVLCGYLAAGRIHGFTPASTMMLLYLALISAVAYSLWGILLKYNPISKVAVFGFMNPVFGVILSAVLLNEKEQAAGVKSILALVLVSIGIYVVNYSKSVDSDKIQ